MDIVVVFVCGFDIVVRCSWRLMLWLMQYQGSKLEPLTQTADCMKKTREWRDRIMTFYYTYSSVVLTSSRNMCRSSFNVSSLE